MPIILAPRYNIWAKFSIVNSLNDSKFLLALNYAYISNIWVYKTDSANNLSLINHTGNSTPFNSRLYNNINFLFPFVINPNQKQTYYIKISTQHPLEVPISITNSQDQYANDFLQQFIIGVYLGNNNFNCSLQRVFIYFNKG